MQTEFLYPFRIPVGRYDIAWWWGLSIHILTGIVLLLFVPDTLAMGLSLFGVISLRAIWDRQAIVRESDVLSATSEQQWYFESSCGRHDYVRLKTIYVFAVFIIVEIERYGSSSYLVQLQGLLSNDQVHRIKILSLHRY